MMLCKKKKRRLLSNVQYSQARYLSFNLQMKHDPMIEHDRMDAKTEL